MSEVAPRSWRASRALDPTTLALIALIVPTFVALGASEGGYFASSWGWSALVFCWAALMALLLASETRVSRPELVFLGGLVGLLVWSGLSLLWTTTVPGTIAELQRTLVYVAFATALTLIVRHARVYVVLGSVLVVVVVLNGYGLATRLFPGRLTEYDTFVSYRLSEPLGYWNAVAGLAALGILLATGFAARASTIVVRGLAAGALVLLLPTFYFTFGRGGWIALFVGLLVTILLDPRRVQYVTALLLAGPWAVLALWQAHGADGLTTDFSLLAEATGDGERLAWIIVLLALGACVTTVVGVLAERRVAIATRTRSAYAVTLVVLAVGLTAVTVVAFGGPAEIIRDARTSPNRSSPNVSGDQTKRLLSLSPNGRFDLWEVAIDAARAHPLQGIGAGAYEQRWDRERPVPSQVRDAHSLPIEIVGELGLVGLLLLGLVLVIPLIAAIRARAHPLVPVAAGCFAAYIAHSALDWDWEMPVLTLSALACAGAVMAAAREREQMIVLSSRARGASACVIVVAIACAFVSMVGNRALAKAESAEGRGDAKALIEHARDAGRWAPWASAPLELEASAALELGERPRARALYRRAIDRDPRNWALWLGLALASEGKAFTRALEEVERLNPLAPELEQLRQPGV